MEQSIGVNKYIIKFSIVYVICLIILSVIFNFLDINGSSGASVGVLIAAAMYSVGKFIEENKRIPSKEEKSKLVWLSLLSSWLISIILVAVFALSIDGIDGFLSLFKVVQEVSSILILCVVFIVSLIYFAILSWSYGGLAKKQLEGLRKKGKI